jgi:hypothetical protein
MRLNWVSKQLEIQILRRHPDSRSLKPKYNLSCQLLTAFHASTHKNTKKTVYQILGRRNHRV